MSKSQHAGATDSAGRTVYYPYGQARSGYILTDPERERAIRIGILKTFPNKSRPIVYCCFCRSCKSSISLSAIIRSLPMRFFPPFSGWLYWSIGSFGARR